MFSGANMYVDVVGVEDDEVVSKYRQLHSVAGVQELGRLCLDLATGSEDYSVGVPNLPFALKAPASKVQEIFVHHVSKLWKKIEVSKRADRMVGEHDLGCLLRVPLVKALF